MSSATLQLREARQQLWSVLSSVSAAPSSRPELSAATTKLDRVLATRAREGQGRTHQHAMTATPSGGQHPTLEPTTQQQQQHQQQQQQTKQRRTMQRAMSTLRMTELRRAGGEAKAAEDDVDGGGDDANDRTDVAGPVKLSASDPLSLRSLHGRAMSVSVPVAKYIQTLDAGHRGFVIGKDSGAGGSDGALRAEAVGDRLEVVSDYDESDESEYSDEQTSAQTMSPVPPQLQRPHTLPASSSVDSLEQVLVGPASEAGDEDRDAAPIAGSDSDLMRRLEELRLADEQRAELQRKSSDVGSANRFGLEHHHRKRSSDFDKSQAAILQNRRRLHLRRNSFPTPSMVAAAEQSNSAASRQQRAAAKRAKKLLKKAEKKRKKKAKQLHKVINRQHKLFALTYSMMLGIRTTVGYTESQMAKVKDYKLKRSDFTEETKLRMPRSGSARTPAHQMRDFKFKDYFPKVFREIRRCFNLDQAQYLLDVCGNFQYLEFISNSKSGAFFFFSHDRKYMIKTISAGEAKFLKKIIRDYYHHIKSNPHTLLVRFYGMHRVKVHKKKEVHFLIMGSVFSSHKFLHHTFDLKGSTHGRSATEKEKRSKAPVLKDNDFTNLGLSINVGPVRARILNQQLERDSEFLAAHGIMDYSLLLGIHYRDRARPHRRRHRKRDQQREQQEQEQQEQQEQQQQEQQELGHQETTSSTTTTATTTTANKPKNTKRHGGQGRLMGPPPGSEQIAAWDGVVLPEMSNSGHEDGEEDAEDAEDDGDDGRAQRPAYGDNDDDDDDDDDLVERKTFDDDDDDSTKNNSNNRFKQKQFSQSSLRRQVSVEDDYDSESIYSQSEYGREVLEPIPSKYNPPSPNKPLTRVPETNSYGMTAEEQLQAAREQRLLEDGGIDDDPSAAAATASAAAAAADSKHDDGGPADGNLVSPSPSPTSAHEYNARHPTQQQQQQLGTDDELSGTDSFKARMVEKKNSIKNMLRKKKKIKNKKEAGTINNSSKGKHKTSPSEVSLSPSMIFVNPHQEEAHDARHHHVGLPRKYKVLSTPYMARFNTPAFAPLPEMFSLDSAQVRADGRRKDSIFRREQGGMRGVNSDAKTPNNTIYYMGIIDILTYYGSLKKVEHAAKSLRHDGNSISAVNPKAYAKRFREFLSKAIH